jgi:hypothetical protein
MMWFSEGELHGEVCRCHRGEVPWFWYRNVLLQAQERGAIRISGHSEERPFWWRKFEDSVEVTSDKLAALMKEETSWGGNAAG